jgi:hypothetical protein
MPTTILPSGEIKATIAVGQGPAGPSTQAAQNAAVTAEAARDVALAQAGVATAAAAQAQAVFDDFDTRYLGAFDSPPTLDNNGDPLVQGALYFDNGLGYLRAYDANLGMWRDSAAAVADAVAARDLAVAASSQAVASAASADASEAQALQYRNEALAARDDLQAASPGVSELNPTAGSAPLADARGFIDEGWMLPVQSATERHAQLAIRRQLMAGSGFLEFGRTLGAATKAAGIGATNERIALGDGANGTSRTTFVMLNSHGIRHAVGSDLAVGRGAGAGEVRVHLPPASTSPALPSFQTLVFAEVFSQAVTGVSGSNRIFPRGFVQNQSSSFSGVTLSNANSPASFSAYGKWDVDNGTAVAGFSLAYSTATRQQLLDLLDDPETAETLWWDGGVLVQDLIRETLIKCLNFAPLRTWAPRVG